MLSQHVEQKQQFTIIMEDSMAMGDEPVNITFDSPSTFKGPVVEGWPPSKDRYMPHYIQPNEDTFLLRPPSTYFKGCKVLIAIHSRIESLQERNKIRSTWKTVSSQACVIFIIGQTSKQDDISQEASIHQDVLQANMVDHYNNLTLKSVFGLKFFLNESNFDDLPQYLMKTDDDNYVNIPQLLKLLNAKELQPSSLFMIGHRWGTPSDPSVPIKNPKNKWFAPKYLFNGSSYPVFIAGAGYVTTRDAARCLYDKAMELPYYFLEDVFMGFAAENCRIPRYHCPAFHNYRVPLHKVNLSDILWTGFKNNEMETMHKLFKKL